MFSYESEATSNGHDHNKWYQSRPILGRPSTTMVDPPYSHEQVLEEIQEGLKKLRELNQKMQNDLESLKPNLVSLEAGFKLLKGVDAGRACDREAVMHQAQQVFDQMPETKTDCKMEKREEVCIVSSPEFKNLKNNGKQMSISSLENGDLNLVDRDDVGEGLKAYPATPPPLPEPPPCKYLLFEERRCHGNFRGRSLVIKKLVQHWASSDFRGNSRFGLCGQNFQLVRLISKQSGVGKNWATAEQLAGLVLSKVRKKEGNSKIQSFLQYPVDLIVMSSGGGANGNLDEQIPQLTQCEPLSKHKVRLVCENYKQPMEIPVSICGDIHGQFHDPAGLFQIGERYSDTNYLFMDDYVDQGYHAETATLLMAFKLQYPNGITILRRNHGSLPITEVYECLWKCGSANVWKILTDLFDYLSLVALVELEILCPHVGPPESKAIVRPTQTPWFERSVQRQGDARRVVEIVKHFRKLDILVKTTASDFFVTEDICTNGFKAVIGIAYVRTYTTCHEALKFHKIGGSGRSTSGGGFILNISATLHHAASWYQVNYVGNAANLSKCRQKLKDRVYILSEHLNSTVGNVRSELYEQKLQKINFLTKQPEARHNWAKEHYAKGEGWIDALLDVIGKEVENYGLIAHGDKALCCKDKHCTAAYKPSDATLIYLFVLIGLTIMMLPYPQNIVMHPDGFVEILSKSLAKRIHDRETLLLYLDAAVESNVMVDPLKAEEKIEAILNGLSTESVITKRKAELMSIRALGASMQKFEFQDRVSQLMDIIINSPYSKGWDDELNRNLFMKYMETIEKCWRDVKREKSTMHDLILLCASSRVSGVRDKSCSSLGIIVYKGCFWNRSKMDVKELKRNRPEVELALDVEYGNAPSYSDLEVGQYILFKVGESVFVDCGVLQSRSTIMEHLAREITSEKQVAKKHGERKFVRLYCGFNISGVGILVHRGLYFGIFYFLKPVVIADSAGEITGMGSDPFDSCTKSSFAALDAARKITAELASLALIGTFVSHAKISFTIVLTVKSGQRALFLAATSVYLGAKTITFKVAVDKTCWFDIEFCKQTDRWHVLLETLVSDVDWVFAKEIEAHWNAAYGFLNVKDVAILAKELVKSMIFLIIVMIRVLRTRLKQGEGNVTSEVLEEEDNLNHGKEKNQKRASSFIFIFCFTISQNVVVLIRFL